MPSCIDTTGHTKAYHYPVMDHWKPVKVAKFQARGALEPTTCQLTDQHANHQTTESPLCKVMTPSVQNRPGLSAIDPTNVSLGSIKWAQSFL